MDSPLKPVPDAGNEDEQSAATRVAAELRDEITRGDLRPEDRLRDRELALKFGVSRTTAREALHLLANQGLAVSRMYSGFMVKRLSVAEASDLYRARRLLETAAVWESSEATDEQLAALAELVATEERLAEAGDWAGAATTNLLFHRGIVSLAGSKSIEVFFDQLLAQLRLVFSVQADVYTMQPFWIAGDKEILAHLLGGDRVEAIGALERYLQASRNWVIDGIRAAALASPPIN